MGDGRRNYGGINYDNPAEGVHQEYSGGSAHIFQKDLYNSDGTASKTEVCSAQPRHLNDVANYTLHSSQGAVDTAELSQIEFTAGEYCTAVLVNAWGGSSFQGAYLTVNAPDATTAALRLKSDNTATTTETRRYFVPAGVIRLFKFDFEVTSVHFVAIDNDATPDNNIEVEPY